MPTRSADRSGMQLLGGSLADTALISGSASLSYGELEERVEARRAQLGPTRRLVMIQGANAIEPIVTYLAALAGRHPVLIVEGGNAGESAERHRLSLVERFDPDVVALPDGDAWSITERREGTRHTLHPDLALLASTSGSTGSPKLVRLSHENLLSNAVAIADYLNLGAHDRAATTLPLHYCYGLSVVNSHLAAGASIALTERSVVEEQFWAEFSAHGATSFAGVPFTFDLLEASDFASRDVPSLRYITQAGGRLEPDRVRRFARLGRDRGFDFVVMYGQTEATARMAYLPPQLAESAAGAIGIPVPGGRFRIDAAAGEAGELVYSGPNVMMGYAEDAADFATGRTIDELRTGDLARVRDDGLYEIVGRSSRFVKIFGLRVDLDRVERLLADDGFQVRAAASDERLLLFVTAERQVDLVRERTGELLGLPAHAIRVHAVAEFPRTASGKPDTAALVRHAAALESAPTGASGAQATPETIRDLYAELLGRPDAGLDDSFAGLDGDSLSYVEVALHLERLLDRLPREWPTMSVRELAGARSADPAPEQRRRRRMPRVETPAVLRAAAIVLIVGTHANLFDIQGGAHLLLAIAGYNLARFQLADVAGRNRVRALLSSTAQVALPAALWIATVALVSGRYDPTTALLVNNAYGSGAGWSTQWQFWFIEAVVWAMIGLAAVFAVPQIDRLERRHPFAFALGVLGIALASRVLLAGGIQAESIERYAAPIVLWCIALGWLVARSITLPQRLMSSALVLITVPGFFGEPGREAIVIVGVLLVLWLPTLPVPRLLVPIVGALAGASMFIYLTHWQVYPHFEDALPWFATALSLVVGVLAWKAYTALVARAGLLFRRRSAARRRG